MFVDNNLVHSKCPFCFSCNVGKIGDIRYFEPLVFSSGKLELARTPELWVCRHCESRFSQYAIPESEAAALYTSGAGGDRWISKHFEEEKTIGVTKILESIFFKGCRVLDVGCNTGEFLDFACSCGCVTVGVEFSTESREIVQAKGHECYSTIADAKGEFDVITGFDLVEHLYDMNGFLSQCWLKLKSKGHVAILTGNVSCLSSIMTGPNWWYVRFPEHIMFPSKKYFYSLEKFLVRTWFQTYAGKKYESSLWSKLFSLYKGIQYRNYMAQPSFVPDHTFVVLNK